MNDIGVELHVPDLSCTRSFYALLGFTVAREEPNYVVMRRDRSELCFYGGTPGVSNHPHFKQFPSDTARGYAVEIILPVDDVELLYVQIKNRVEVVEELNIKRWGLKDFRIVDPFGFYIRVTQRTV